MDVEALLDEAAVLLDITETSLERIIHTILNKTLDILDAPLAYAEAMSTLFLPESGNILAKTIQVSPETKLPWLASELVAPYSFPYLNKIFERSKRSSKLSTFASK